MIATTTVTSPDDTVKRSTRLPRSLDAWICARSNDRPSQGIRDAIAELHRLRTSAGFRTVQDNLPKGPPPVRDMAFELYHEWCTFVERGRQEVRDGGFRIVRVEQSEAAQLDLILRGMARRRWIVGSDEYRTAKPWIQERARDVLDALRGIRAVGGLR